MAQGPQQAREGRRRLPALPAEAFRLWSWKRGKGAGPLRPVLGLFLLAFLAVACEYPGVLHPLAASAPSLDSAAPSSAAPGAQQGEARLSAPALPGTTEKQGQAGTSQEALPPQVLQGTVPVSLKDFRLEPNELRVKAGTVTVVLKNEGRFTHDFRVQGQGIDDRAPKVGSGRTFEWQIALEPGSYAISCPISNHAQRGMKGTLEVVP